MITEIRTYTANRGMLDGLVDVLNRIVFPAHRSYGITIGGLWIDRPQSEVIWMRLFDSLEDKAEKLARYDNSDDLKAVLPLVAELVIRPGHSRVVEAGFNPSTEVDDALLNGDWAQQARATWAARSRK